MFHAVHELLAHPANVFAHWDTSVMQMIKAKDATYEVNVTSIKIVRAPKFASNSAVEFETVSMLAVNSHVDQMHCVYRIIIVRRVFAAMALLEIQMISMLAVDQVNNSEYQIHAKAMPNVHRVKFVWLV